MCFEQYLETGQSVSVQSCLLINLINVKQNILIRHIQVTKCLINKGTKRENLKDDPGGLGNCAPTLKNGEYKIG